MQDKILLKGENFHHLAHVLRARVGEQVEVCDGKGQDYFCICSAFEKDHAALRIQRTAANAAEQGPRITLYQCVAKGEKMELIITRTIEMGVHRIVPVMSRFCVARPAEAEKKLERWRKIALAAAKQSGRGIVPRIEPMIDIGQAIEQMASAENAFVCYEKEQEQSLCQIPMTENISFLVGSEGGLAEEEATLWQQKGIAQVTLGKRILRTENAAAYVLPILHYKSMTEVEKHGK